jgi:hypothetical protein
MTAALVEADEAPVRVRSASIVVGPLMVGWWMAPLPSCLRQTIKLGPGLRADLVGCQPMPQLTFAALAHLDQINAWCTTQQVPALVEMLPVPELLDQSAAEAILAGLQPRSVDVLIAIAEATWAGRSPRMELDAICGTSDIRRRHVAELTVAGLLTLAGDRVQTYTLSARALGAAIAAGAILQPRRPGPTKCLSCGNTFSSHDVRRNRVCDRCKADDAWRGWTMG